MGVDFIDAESGRVSAINCVEVVNETERRYVDFRSCGDMLETDSIEGGGRETYTINFVQHNGAQIINRVRIGCISGDCLKVYLPSTYNLLNNGEK